MRASILTIMMALLMGARPSFAEIVIDRNDFQKWVKAFNNEMPSRYKFKLDYDLEAPAKMNQEPCYRVERYEITGSRVKHRRIIFNAYCLDRYEINEIQNGTFDLKTISRSKIKSILLKETVYSNSRFREASRHSLSEYIYKNNYFNSLEQLSISIEQSIKDVVFQFYHKATLRYIGDSKLFDINPQVYCFFKVHIFDGVDYYNQDCSNVAPTVRTNTAQFATLHTPEDALYARYEILRRAHTSIRFQYFSLFNELFGKAFLGLLRRKALEGVRVEVMLDRRGTFNEGLTPYLESLVNAGAIVRMYNPIFLNAAILNRTFRTGLLESIPNSNHDKIIIVDDEYVIVGGRNIAERYFVREEEALTFVYEDLDVVLKTKTRPFNALKAFYTEFYADVNRPVSGNKNLNEKYPNEIDEALSILEAVMFNRVNTDHMEKYPEIENYLSIRNFLYWDLQFSKNYVTIEGLDNTSQYYDIKEINDRFVDLINEAQDSIVIQNPYIVISEEIFNALKTAAVERKVKIIFVVSTYKSTDLFPPVNDLTDNWERMLTEMKGARMFGYIGDYKSHTKLAIFDGSKTVIGSYNLDPLSAVKNSEFVYLIDSKEVARDSLRKVNDTLKESIEYDVEKGIGPLDIPDKEKTEAYRYRWLNIFIRDII